MGAFAEAVEIFTAQGIGVIPTRRETPAMPMVKHPDRFGVPASRRLVENPRFEEANAAIWAGRHSRLTIVDIDSKEPAHVAEAIKAFGDTPLKVSTPSGGMHLYYRHAGEQRRIRPFGKSLPLDILGNGVAVVPPSSREPTGKKAGGSYRVIEGNLAALDVLPSLRAGTMPPNRFAENFPTDGTPPDSMGELREGDGRDNALFACARALAMASATEVKLIEAVLIENSRMAEPLPDVVARAKAASAWRYKVEGRLLGQGARIALGTCDEVLLCASYPPAFTLLAYLRCNHASSRREFAVPPNALGPILSQSPMTTRKARDWLIRAGFLILKRQGKPGAGGQHSPNLYALGAPGRHP